MYFFGIFIGVACLGGRKMESADCNDEYLQCVCYSLNNIHIANILYKIASYPGSSAGEEPGCEASIRPNFNITS